MTKNTRRTGRLKRAEAAAVVLDKGGHKVDAESVRCLIRSHRSLAETTTRLYKDNMELRTKLEVAEAQIETAMDRGGPFA